MVRAKLLSMVTGLETTTTWCDSLLNGALQPPGASDRTLFFVLGAPMAWMLVTMNYLVRAPLNVMMAGGYEKCDV